MIITILTTLAFTLLIKYLFSISSKPKIPQVPGALPLIGHLHLFRPSLKKAFHITLGEMANKYGPIFTIKLGVGRFVIVNNSEIAKECFTTNDKILDGRSKSLASKIMGYNHALILLAPCSHHWRNARKIMTLELLSNQKLEIFKPVGESILNAFVKEIYNRNRVYDDKNVVVEMKRWFEDINMSVIFRMLAGKSYCSGDLLEEEKEKNKRFVEALHRFVELATNSLVVDLLPYLGWWYSREISRDLKRMAEDLDQVLQGWVEEHKHKRLLGEGKGKKDFIYAILSILDEDKELLNDYDLDTFIKSTCLALIVGAGDATTLTLTWALSLLLNNPHVLQKAQQELDTHVGKERLVQDSDLQNLVYLQAILKETLRLYPPGPVSAPHQATQDCTINGYHISAGIDILVNFSKLHRDPITWPDPDAFQPERFLTSSHKDFDFRGHNYELIPFGAGRRICPAMAYGLQVTQLTLAKLLHCFEIVSATGGPIDMTDSVLMINLKKTKLDVLLSPRLPAHVAVAILSWETVVYIPRSKPVGRRFSLKETKTTLSLAFYIQSLFLFLIVITMTNVGENMAANVVGGNILVVPTLNSAGVNGGNAAGGIQQVTVAVPTTFHVNPHEDALKLDDADVNTQNVAAVAAVDAWKHSNYLCKNTILNGLTNSLFGVYSTFPTSKAL
ncbi:xanthotoxin 5-hydroxylase CYP82C4-like [Tripterygium wilfordii]|uniref:xanthotoxin 5-hydroxylase CYP82C4-like n=1 Tax=Tripterygium wilfordii TaxID=458696 RepID=UPI0018F85AF7|nr:xanthotoxin 5-hydroxylase CYP82C4-like [Tripterygium wilfordii]